MNAGDEGALSDTDLGDIYYYTTGDRSADDWGEWEQKKWMVQRDLPDLYRAIIGVQNAARTLRLEATELETYINTRVRR